MGTYEAYTAIAAGILSDLDRVSREVHIMANQQTTRIVNPSQWTSTEKPDLSFHTCTDRCTKSDDPDMTEVCEVTEEELHRAYLKAASMLSSVRFMMGVPGSFGPHDEGIETYDEAKRRADEKRAQLKRIAHEGRRTR